MKKLLALVVCVCMGIVAMSAGTRVSRNIKDLPAQAQSTLSQYFGKKGVNHIKIESKAFGGHEYDVILNDGTEIEFDANGNWKEINCGSAEVPSGLILRSITSYVKNNYKGQKIVKIEANRNNYEIELYNGLDLKFSRDGKFLRIDD